MFFLDRERGRESKKNKFFLHVQRLFSPARAKLLNVERECFGIRSGANQVVGSVLFVERGLLFLHGA
jgi:hypothetical protein